SQSERLGIGFAPANEHLRGGVLTRRRVAVLELDRAPEIAVCASSHPQIRRHAARNCLKRHGPDGLGISGHDCSPSFRMPYQTKRPARSWSLQCRDLLLGAMRPRDPRSPATATPL